MLHYDTILATMLVITVTNLCRISQVYCAKNKTKKYPPAKLTKDAEGLRQHIGRINLVQIYVKNYILNL